MVSTCSFRPAHGAAPSAVCRTGMEGVVARDLRCCDRGPPYLVIYHIDATRIVNSRHEDLDPTNRRRYLRLMKYQRSTSRPAQPASAGEVGRSRAQGGHHPPTVPRTDLRDLALGSVTCSGRVHARVMATTSEDFRSCSREALVEGRRLHLDSHRGHSE